MVTGRVSDAVTHGDAQMDGVADRVGGMSSLQRAQGTARLAFSAKSGRTQVFRSYQEGALKVRYPRQFDSEVPEAVLINTAGGITGGDRYSIDLDVGAGAVVTMTSQAAEKIYRSSGGEGRVQVTAKVEPQARLDWLPQETILFESARLRRHLQVEMSDDATVLLLESVVLGRLQSGEVLTQGHFSDRWTLRRGGRLIYADYLTVEAERLATSGLGGLATLGEARAFASLVAAGPGIETRIDEVRSLLPKAPAMGGASAWNGLLSVRLLAPEGSTLKASLLPIVHALAERVPRAWSL